MMDSDFVSEDGGRYGAEDDPETYAVIGAAMEVHNHLGWGLSEPIYQESLEIECCARGIPVGREMPIPIFYKGQRLKKSYRLDFLAFGNLVVEAKALSRWSGEEESQVLSYLKATRLKRALILNFGAPRLSVKRMML